MKDCLNCTICGHSLIRSVNGYYADYNTMYMVHGVSYCYYSVLSPLILYAAPS